jgi:hypothetical protein
MRSCSLRCFAPLPNFGRFSAAYAVSANPHGVR